MRMFARGPKLIEARIIAWSENELLLANRLNPLALSYDTGRPKASTPSRCRRSGRWSCNLMQFKISPRIQNINTSTYRTHYGSTLVVIWISRWAPPALQFRCIQCNVTHIADNYHKFLQLVSTSSSAFNKVLGNKKTRIKLLASALATGGKGGLLVGLVCIKLPHPWPAYRYKVRVCLCMCVCVYVCEYVCVHVCAFVRLPIYVCVHIGVCMSVCTCMCVKVMSVYERERVWVCCVCCVCVW
jgi:hypothetical protein